MVGIVTAMPEERSAVLKQVRGVQRARLATLDLYRGSLAGRELAVVEGGMGSAAATRATQLLIKELNPAIILSSGYCGAVRPGPQTGDLVLCCRLFTADSTGLQELTLPGNQLAAGRLAAGLQQQGLQAWQGSFITTHGIVTKAALAASLDETLPHPVLEMESAAVALAAAEANIPFLGLRAVSDDAAEELQFSLNEICGKDGQVSVGRVLWLLARRPLLLGQFLRLAAGSAKAGTSLGQALEKLVPLL